MGYWFKLYYVEYSCDFRSLIVCSGVGEFENETHARHTLHRLETEGERDSEWEKEQEEWRENIWGAERINHTRLREEYKQNTFRVSYSNYLRATVKLEWAWKKKK